MVQRCDNLVDLDKCCKMSIHFQRLVPIQPRTSPLQFIWLKNSEYNTISYLSTQAPTISRHDGGFRKRSLICSAPCSTRNLGDLYTERQQTLQGALSAVRREGKLYRAGSRLHRSRFLQPNAHWKTIGELLKNFAHYILHSTILESQFLLFVFS